MGLWTCNVKPDCATTWVLVLAQERTHRQRNHNNTMGNEPGCQSCIPELVRIHQGDTDDRFSLVSPRVSWLALCISHGYPASIPRVVLHTAWCSLQSDCLWLVIFHSVTIIGLGGYRSHISSFHFKTVFPSPALATWSRHEGPPLRQMRWKAFISKSDTHQLLSYEYTSCDFENTSCDLENTGLGQRGKQKHSSSTARVWNK